MRRFANSVYRTAARLSGLVLKSADLVDSVFVHRSVATGEISFGRSDIDLVLVVRQPDSESADGPELASLHKKVCALRRFNPALGHMAVQDWRGIKESVESDTYLGSVDRRSALIVSGKPFVLPDVPVRHVHALRRFAFWQDSYLGTAFRRGDKRNLRKIAADMWNSYAVATGRLQVPFLTRREAEAHRHNCQDADLPDGKAWNPERSPALGFLLAKRLHDMLLPPLKPLRETVVRQVTMAPRFRERSLVILPEANSPIPAEALKPGSLLSTPELLHLYLHYVCPFLDWTLPPELRRLGFQHPTPAEFVRACLFYGHSHTTRNPGFMHGDVTAPAKGIALLRHSAPYLRNGEVPPPLPQRQIDAASKHRPSVSGYFRGDFAGIYCQTQELWGELRCL
ncbi:MAG: hypothetical protein EHM65_04375, partial [Acidobacteriales bacterium]